MRVEVRLSCSETTSVAMEGGLGADGCGREPPTADWYVGVPVGTTLSAATTPNVSIPHCVDLHQP